jgi:hypothetical protein
VVSNSERAAREARRLFDRAYAAAYLNADGEPAHARRYAADIAAMTEREAAETAELAFRPRLAWPTRSPRNCRPGNPSLAVSG